MSDEADNQTRSALERHAQTIIGLAALALLAWIFDTVQTVSVTVATQTVEIQALKSQLALVSQQAFEDRYRGEDAIKDFDSRDARIDGLQRRIERLEGRP